jgi:hypothetical protein
MFDYLIILSGHKSTIFHYIIPGQKNISQISIGYFREKHMAGWENFFPVPFTTRYCGAKLLQMTQKMKY